MARHSIYLALSPFLENGDSSRENVYNTRLRKKTHDSSISFLSNYILDMQISCFPFLSANSRFYYQVKVLIVSFRINTTVCSITPDLFWLGTFSVRTILVFQIKTSGFESFPPLFLSQWRAKTIFNGFDTRFPELNDASRRDSS